MSFIDASLVDLLLLSGHLGFGLASKFLGWKVCKHSHLSAGFACDLKDAASPFFVDDLALGLLVADDLEVPISFPKHRCTVSIQALGPPECPCSP